MTYSLDSKNFAAQYNYAINDPDLIRRYRMYEDAEHDIATKLSAAEKRGEKAGTKSVKRSTKGDRVMIRYC